MISQTQNNFRTSAAALLVSISTIAIPVTAMADAVSAEFVAADWLIFVKSENSSLSELSRHVQGPAGLTQVSTTLNLDGSADTLEQNYLYIVVGNRIDGREPFLAGRLRGDKSIVTGDRTVSVRDTNSQDRMPPTSISYIQELIDPRSGGSPYAATAPLRVASPTKAVNGEMIAGAWSPGQVENGAVNIFRIPYTSLFAPPRSDMPEQVPEDRASAGGGVTVNVDVGSLLGSLFGKKDKKKDTPKEDVAATMSSDPVVAEGSAANTTTSQTSSSASSTPSTTENEAASNAPVITPPPEIITQYVSDPDVLADRDRLLEERTGMLNYITGLTNVIKEREATIRDLRGNLTRAQNGVDSVPALLTPLQAQISTQTRELSAQKDELADKVKEIGGLNKRIADLEDRPAPLPITALIAGGLGLLGLGGLTGLMLGRKRHNKTCESHLPPAKKEEDEEEPPKESSSFDTLKKGMCFAASPMALGGLPAALGAAKPVYDAVGRIGFAQNGKPVGKDESFGTGILVSERHILTNRHVWEMFKGRLSGDEGTGIEFYGEKKSDKSEFITFDGAAPICIDGWDAAIFTLSRTPENRPPVSIASRPAEELNDLDIVVVGYPQAHRVTEDIAEVTEKDPVFGVKRYSEGKIFRHSVDIENPYGVEAAVEQIINPSETLRAICHNASTLGGSSGSAVICKKTGDLIALHFGFDSAYEWKEAANFALAGEDLAQSVASITKSVTTITEKSES